MKKYNKTEYVEIFHLVFLDFLGRKVKKDHFVLKGGCNLRFFMNSIRYSGDMDVDIQTTPKDKLHTIVSNILDSTPFKKILQVRGIELANWNDPKQTETTQRWKMQVRAEGHDALLHTKIEFSRRGLRGTSLFEPVAPSIISTYSMTPIMASHYDMHSAYNQKVGALADRRETQARDIFDIHLLIGAGADTNNKDLDPHKKEAAAQRSTDISHDMFMSQVVSYLHPDYREQYSSPEAWDGILLKVIDALTGSV